MRLSCLTIYGIGRTVLLASVTTNTFFWVNLDEVQFIRIRLGIRSVVFILHFFHDNPFHTPLPPCFFNELVTALPPVPRACSPPYLEIFPQAAPCTHWPHRNVLPFRIEYSLVSTFFLQRKKAFQKDKKFQIFFYYSNTNFYFILFFCKKILTPPPAQGMMPPHIAIGGEHACGKGSPEPQGENTLAREACSVRAPTAAAFSSAAQRSLDDGETHRYHWHFYPGAQKCRS